MAITRLTKHDSHRVSIQRSNNSAHYAELRCTDCNKHIQWLSKKDFFCLSMGTDINNNNYNINNDNNVIISVPHGNRSVKDMSLRDSLGYATSLSRRETAKGEISDSKGVRETAKETTL